MLDTAFINFSDSERQYVNSTMHSVRMLVKDFMEVIHKEKVESLEDTATIDQMRKSTKFLADLIKARQLKTALMCWMSSSTLPLDPKVYNQVFTQYKNDIFWKIMSKKETLPSVGGLKAMESEMQAAASKAAAKEDNPNKRAEGSMVQNQ